MSSSVSSPLIPDDLVSPFTQRINKLARSQQHAYWYVKRAEDYLKAVKLRPINLHSHNEVHQYLSELGRNASLTAWQFRQCVEAIGVLLRVAGAPAIREVDWHYWLEAAKELGLTHATTDTLFESASA